MSAAPAGNFSKEIILNEYVKCQSCGESIAATVWIDRGEMDLSWWHTSTGEFECPIDVYGVS